MKQNIIENIQNQVILGMNHWKKSNDSNNMDWNMKEKVSQELKISTYYEDVFWSIQSLELNQVTGKFMKTKMFEMFYNWKKRNLISTNHYNSYLRYLIEQYTGENRVELLEFEETEENKEEKQKEIQEQFKKNKKDSKSNYLVSFE